jgi:hypothetical protein
MLLPHKISTVFWLALTAKFFKNPNYNKKTEEIGLQYEAWNNVCVKLAAHQKAKYEGSMD